MSTPNQVVWNTNNAGQTVPVKWILTQAGRAVSDFGSFAGLWSYPVSCSTSTGSIGDAGAQTAPLGSGLRYNGGGRWQFNWKTAQSYQGTCRAMVVKFSDETVSPAAYFRFR